MRSFGFAGAVLCAAAFFTSAAVSAFPEYDPGSEQILVYTRKAEPNSYPDGLARSVHFARSTDGKNFTAMNGNYGILFAKATISPENTIRPNFSRVKPTDDSISGEKSFVRGSSNCEVEAIVYSQTASPVSR